MLKIGRRQGIVIGLSFSITSILIYLFWDNIWQAILALMGFLILVVLTITILPRIFIKKIASAGTYTIAPSANKYLRVPPGTSVSGIFDYSLKLFDMTSGKVKSSDNKDLVFYTKAYILINAGGEAVITVPTKRSVIEGDITYI